jgi:phosphodiesterase/alkaline phosphatase D-like protein
MVMPQSTPSRKDTRHIARPTTRALLAMLLLAAAIGSTPARAQNPMLVEKHGSGKHTETLAPSPAPADAVAQPVMWEVGPASPEVTNRAGSPSIAARPQRPLSPESDGPEPTGWYSGDMHVHRSCGETPVPVSTIYDAMVAQDVAVVSLLADMGNGEVPDPVTDLPLVTGEDDPISTPGRIVHWDAEWHWDATYAQYPHHALGGHLNNLGLKEAHQIWDEYTHPIIDWAHRQGGISGFVHMQYLPDGIPQSLDCCIPLEYPVEVALGAADYIAEDVNGGDAAIQAYYRLLNCGFRPGFAAGTDAPCGQVIGPLVTFAQVPGTLTYRGWIDAIARGRTVVSRVGSGQFLDEQVNGTATPGDEVQLTTGGDVQVSVHWSADQSVTGTIELVHNGVVVASEAASAGPGAPGVLTTTVNVPQSGWLCARVMGGGGHMLHTAAVFVTVAGAPVRANVDDAQFFVDWTTQLIEKTSPGGAWDSYFQDELAAAQAGYQAARTIYEQIAAGGDVAPFVVWQLPASSGTDVLLGANLTAKFNQVLDPATVSGATFLLQDASHNPVAAGVSYDAGSRTAVLTPSAPLGYSTTYTATLVGGSSGIKDPAGSALAADVSWSFTTQGQDLTAPTMTSRSPLPGATGMALSTTVTATFSEALDPATVSTGTFELRNATEALVTATVTLSSAGQVATLAPTAALAYATTYTATLKGGAGGIEDLAGNPLAADATWSFTTLDPPPPPPDEGPGGPILVIGAASNPFTRYYAEILRAEGLNAFMVRDISQVDATYLAGYDVAILGEMPLDAGQVQMLTDWVTITGGNLIAMRPDKQLAPLLGLTAGLAGDTLSNKYLLVDTGSGPGAGIVNQTIQFHGKADLYGLNGATALAMLYSDASTPTTNPGVTMRDVGASGGVAVAFTYDLARSVVYTRQGNPAWAGQERDGNSPKRGDDLFFGNAAGDPQPNWFDFNKVAIPQADEQQRLLANIVLKVNLDRKPLPRFWYFPRGKKAVVIMTGDNHGDAGMRPRFDTYMQQSDSACSVDDWECIRASGYLFLSGGFPDSAAARYDSYGFETGLHVNTGCGDFTPASFEANFTDQMADFTSVYPSLPVPESERNHCVVWSDWSTVAEVEVAHGSRLDTNYYYWNPGGVGSWPGMFTGSGMPMRFARLDGSMIDCYQACTQMTDESGQSYPFTIDALLDKALGAEGYYGAFTTNMHFDSPVHGGSDAIVASAKARGVPVVSGRQMLRWLDGRNASKFEALAWNDAQHRLSFTITPGAGARNLEAMLPVQGGIGDLTGITLAGVPITYRTEMIKGIQYGIFPAAPGDYVAQYLEDTFPPTISSVVATVVDDGIATVTWTTNEPSTSHVEYGTAPDDLTLNVEAGAMVTTHTLTLTGLAANQTYYYRVSSTDAADNTTIYPETGQPPASFTTPPLACLKDDTEAQFAQGTPGAGTVVSSIGNGAVTLAMTAGSEFNGTALDPGWETILPPTLPGTATVGNGVVRLNGALIRTTGDYPSGRSLEFVATFSGAANEHAGLGVDLNNSQWAIFSTFAGGGLYARINASGMTDLPISGSWLNAPHRYRIDWNPGSVVFWIDGGQVATTTNSPTQNLRPVASDLANDGTAITVDWMRMTPYAGSGSFLSRVYGGASAVTWGSVTWTAQIPDSTGLAIYVHHGDTDTPDGTWTAFVPVAASGDIIGGRTKYIQYRADLSTSDGRATPVLEQLHIACTAELDEAPPVISGVSATPTSSAATIAWTTNEVANSRVDFGTSPDTLAQHVSGASFTLAHSLQLTGLTPQTQYHYAITSRDPSGNPAVEPPSGSPLSFTTMAHTTPPVISDVTATLATSGIEATIAWTTDEAATSVVLYGTDEANLDLIAQVTGLATSHSVPLIGLAAGTRYYYRVRSVDAYDVTATFPAAPAIPLSFNTPQEGCFVDATAADFGLGDVGTGTWVEEKTDGEVVLKAALSTDFSGSAMPNGWVATHWGSAGGLLVSGGLLTVDSYRVLPDPYGVGPGHTLEFMATIGSQGNRHLGFGGGGPNPPNDVFNTAPWAIFSTGLGGGALQARTNLGGVEDNQTIPGSWLGAPHRYRIDWGATQVDFYIDGTLVSTHTVSLPGPMRPAISDGLDDNAAITVDWLRVTPFAPSGTFTSRVFSRSTVSTWHTVTWTADTPAGSGLAVGVRLGNTPAPDISWTGFGPVTSGQDLAVHSRYVQYQALLSTPDTMTTPVLRDLTITCAPYDDTVVPTITAVAATPDPSGRQATVTWSTDEVANARVDYGTAPDTLTSNVSTALFFVAHRLQLTGLTPATTYYYRVTSADPSGNSATSPVPAEAPLSFATPADTTRPVISAVVATADPLIPQAMVTWTTDEAATSVVHYGLSESNLDLTASVGGLVTAHSVPLTGLAFASTYHFRVESADVFGNTAASPSPPAAPLSFATPAAPCPADATAADFALGNPGADTRISPLGDGEVILRPAEVTEFSGSTLPVGWTVTTWAGGGTATVLNGLLTVAAAMAESPTVCNPGASLEFVATFGAETYQHIGFESGGGGFSRYVLFSTNASTNAVYARATDAGVQIGGPELIGTPHRYRIVWNTNTIEYFVDGQSKATRTVTVAGPMYPLVSDLTLASPSLTVDWMRIGPYPAAGTFTSRVFYGGGPTNWGVVSWNEGTPSGTSLAVNLRGGDTGAPDSTWTEFFPVANGSAAGINSRYVQYRADLASGGADTPALQDIAIACASGSDFTWPVISSVTATPAPSGQSATVTWATNEPSNSRVSYGTSPGALALNVSATARVKSHSLSLTGLTSGTTYYFRVISADGAGNSAMEPDPLASPLSFMTPMQPCFVDRDSTSFGSGTLTDAAVSIVTDGEVILAPTIGSEFSGTDLPSGWMSVSWGGPGPTVSNGGMTIDGARVTPVSTFTYSRGRTLEFVATFTGASQHLGLAAGDNSTGGSSMFNTSGWVIFSTVTQSTNLYARVTGNADVSLGTAYPGGSNYIGNPHRYRIEWRTDSVVFLVDGRSVSRQGASPSVGMRPGVSDGVGGGSIRLDWLRMSPYASSGIFVSRIYDGGGPMSWGAASWNASQPTGTTLAMFARGGDSADTTTWTTWKPIGSSGSSVDICSRYLQYKALLGTSDAGVSPALEDVSITCGPAVALTAVTGLACTPATSGNDASGRTRIQLDWSSGGGGGGGVKVYRKGYGDYPAYRDGVGAVPAAPATPTVAQANGWTLTGVTASGQSDHPLTRDLWYYVAFATDLCGNASPVSNLAGGTLDYVLGDVTDGSTACAGDNVVTAADVSLLGWNYGGLTSEPAVPACLDVGPTVGGSPQGRPLPDGILEFEDLVIFALNYYDPPPGPGVLPARRAAPAAVVAAANALALVVPDPPAVGETFAVTVHAAGAGDVHAVSLTLGYDHSVAEMLKAEAGELLNHQGSQAAVLSPGPGRVDVALLGKGAGLSGEGELVRVEFRVKSAGRPAIVLARADARDGANRRVAMDGTPRPQTPVLPAVTCLAPARPNPFLRELTIAYSLTRGGQVDLAVYAVDGRRVRTIVRDFRGPGEYEETWDGRDAGGHATAAGVYYVRLVTDQGPFVRRVTYLR